MPAITTIQVRRGNAADWTTQVLAEGEIGFEKDTNKFKVGDGTTAWGSLPYAPAGISYLSTSGTTSTVSVERSANVAGGTAGDLLYQSASNTTSKLNIGTNGQSLVVESGALLWAKPVLSTTYFASTTSAQLINVISDSNGTGTAVFGTSPTLTTPTITTNSTFTASGTTITLSIPTSAGTNTVTLPSSAGTLALQSAVDTKLSLSGGTMTGALNMGTKAISGVTTLTTSSTVTMNNIGGASTGVAKINSSGVLTGGNAVSLTGDVNGVLPLANGGLGDSTVSGARATLRVYVQSAVPQGSNSGAAGYIAGYTPVDNDLVFW
jgi:hypothetical protein